MKKILCIAASMDTGGAETFLMKVFRGIDREKWHMDFCVTKKERGFYDDEIESNGSKIFRITQKTESLSKFKKELSTVIKENGYDVVFRSGASCFTALDLWVAKKCGVKVRVLRSSNAGTMQGKFQQFINVLCRGIMTSVANVKMAPSMLAAEYTFGKKIAHDSVCILNNGLDTQRYLFNSEVRNAIRSELGIEDKFVVGHVGRFNAQKNHSFLIDVFNDFQQRKDSVLLLIGTGEEQDNIKEKVKQLGIEDKVYFMGVKSNVADYMMAMDMMLFPSLFEGMPNVIIEAQTTGLPCLISDAITKEVLVTDCVQMLSLNDTKEVWAQTMININCNKERTAYAQKMADAGYEMQEVIKRFCEEIDI